MWVPYLAIDRNIPPYSAPGILAVGFALEPFLTLPNTAISASQPGGFVLNFSCPGQTLRYRHYIQGYKGTLISSPIHIMGELTPKASSKGGRARFFINPTQVTHMTDVGFKSHTLEWFVTFHDARWGGGRAGSHLTRIHALNVGAQYAWLVNDLGRINRNITPWLVAAWHAPWYSSYSAHYQESECMRQEMEAILYQRGVDIVFSGHVHAYERMNRVFNYTLNPCRPVYITIGDGGNIEKVEVDHADDPGKCPRPGDNVPEIGPVCHLNFTSGPAKGKFYWDRQPEWSAFRESSFGHGILEVMNSSHALWTWHRNQDIYRDDRLGDQIYIVRQPELCSISISGLAIS